MIFKTKRTTFTPFTMDDITNVMEMYKESDSFKFVKPLRDKSEAFYLDFLNKKALANKTKVEYWSITDSDNGQFIGTVNLNPSATISFAMQIGMSSKKGFLE